MSYHAEEETSDIQLIRSSSEQKNLVNNNADHVRII